MGAVGEADRAARARHFLHRHAMLEIAEAEPAIFLRRGDPVQAERPHLRPEVAGKEVVAVDRRGARGDLLLGEGPGAVADHVGALAEVEVERTGSVGDHGRALRGRVGRTWRQSAAFGKAAAAREPSRIQIQPNPAKSSQDRAKPIKGKGLDFLGSLGGIEPFQEVAATTTAFASAPPRARRPPVRARPAPSLSSTIILLFHRPGHQQTPKDRTLS